MELNGGNEDVGLGYVDGAAVVLGEPTARSHYNEPPASASVLVTVHVCAQH